VVAHNTINRLTGHVVEDGGLYFQSELFPAGPIDTMPIGLVSRGSAEDDKPELDNYGEEVGNRGRHVFRPPPAPLLNRRSQLSG